MGAVAGVGAGIEAGVEAEVAGGKEKKQGQE